MRPRRLIPPHTGRPLRARIELKDYADRRVFIRPGLVERVRRWLRAKTFGML